MSAEMLSGLAPAKINLRLKVTGRRADGYHLLSMLNATIGLFDRVSIEFSGTEIELETSEHKNIGPAADNTLFKAAHLFFEELGLPKPGMKIYLEKNIPIGAGLGGGSSDAAILLKLLAERFCKNISNKKLIEIASKVGSDVPYFIEGGLCLVGGVGEKVSKLASNPLLGRNLLLICPDEHSSTVEVYKAFAKKNPTESLKSDISIKDLDYPFILDLIENDLSSEVTARSALCRSIMQQLQGFPDFVCSVTGSGSSIFCLSRAEEPDFTKMQEALPDGTTSKILSFY